MKKLMKRLALGAFVPLLAVASTLTAAVQHDETSTFTLTETLEVGGYTLQPGTYVIKVVPIETNRDMLQISNPEKSKVFATVLSRPHPILSDEVIPTSRYIVYATPAGQPQVLRTWFAGDRGIGHDIVYPKARAMELAAAAKQPVIAVPDEVKEAEFKTAPLLVVTPEREVKPYEAPAPAPAVVAEATPAKSLPKTASHVPLFALLGLISLGGAIGLRVFMNPTA